MKLVIFARCKLDNFSKSSASGYQVICFPVKIRNASAGWSRVVAMFED